MLSEKKVEKAGMKIHSILFGLLILCFFLPCALLHNPGKVNGLQVNGQEANETYTIGENTKVNVSCSVVNGTPPDTVRLLDKRGQQYNSTILPEGLVTMSLGPFHCQHEWPTIRCEAPGSKLNRSVTILIKCPPKFSDINGKDFISDSYLKFWKTILFLGSSCVLLVTIFTAAVILCVCNRRPFDESSDCITAAGEATTELQTPVGKNSDGLVYGELDFSDKITSDVIIGTVPETQYSNILFTANADTSQ
ncbi:uncharacterized protein LOC112567458 [Pomacea canaliculata]|uniref:uncharacterized protein LOC112567458 n=1 Tax=Pomacea canaliculata TaxID=400727 RepID=UPI000D72A6A5|nr:uncharacterized protein LOC112567458 [Pomacea canaliculata]